MRDGVDELAGLYGLGYLHGFDLLCGPGVISQDTHPEGARDGCSQSERDAFSEGSENVFAFFAKGFSESRNPLGVCRVMRSVSGIENSPADEAESRPLPGAACSSLAVSERTRRTKEIDLACRFPGKLGSAFTCSTAEIRASIIKEINLAKYGEMLPSGSVQVHC
jgi:hypothetical protein